jgi:nicotinamidase-related amidase
MSSTYQYRRITKDDAAVLFVDHQCGLIALVTNFSPSGFKNSVMALAEMAKFFNLPTILTTSFETGPNGPIMPELKELFPQVPFIARPGLINAWNNEDFVKAIKETGRKQLIIAGVVADVRGTFNLASRDAAWLRMATAGVQLLNWFAVSLELQRDWRNDIQGFGKLLCSHTPVYQNLAISYAAKHRV